MQQPAQEAERELPLHAMQVICQRLSVQDLQALRLTCKSWKAAASTSVSAISVEWQGRGSRNACCNSSNSFTLGGVMRAVDPAVAQAVAAYPESRQLRLQISVEVLKALRTLNIITDSNAMGSDSESINILSLDQWWIVRSLLWAITGGRCVSDAPSSANSSNSAAGTCYNLQYLPELLYVEALLPHVAPANRPTAPPQVHEDLLLQLLQNIDDEEQQMLQLPMHGGEVESHQAELPPQQQVVTLSSLCKLLKRVYLLSAALGSRKGVPPALTAAAAAGHSSNHDSSSSSSRFLAPGTSGPGVDSSTRQPRQAPSGSQPQRLVLHTNLQWNRECSNGRRVTSDWRFLNGLHCLDSLILSSSNGSNNSSSGSSNGMSCSLNCCPEIDALVGTDFAHLTAAAGQLRCLVAAVTGYEAAILMLGNLTNLQQLHLHGMAVDSRFFYFALNSLQSLRSLHLSGDIWVSDLVDAIGFWPHLTSLHLQQALLPLHEQPLEDLALENLPLEDQQLFPPVWETELQRLLREMHHLQQLGMMDAGTFREQIQFTGESRTDELLLLQRSLHDIIVQNDAAILEAGEAEDNEELLVGVLAINEDLTMPAKDAAKALANALSSSRMGNNHSSLLKQQLAGRSSSAASSFLTALPAPGLPSSAAAAIKDDFTSPFQSVSHMMSFVRDYHDRQCCSQQQQQQGDPRPSTSRYHRLSLLSLAAGQGCNLSKILADPLPVSLEIETLPSLVEVLHAMNWPLSLRPGFRGRRLDLQLLPAAQGQLAQIPAAAGVAALAGQLLRSLSISTRATGGGLDIDGSVMAVINRGCPNLLRLQLEGQLVFLDGSSRSSNRKTSSSSASGPLGCSNGSAAAAEAAAAGSEVFDALSFPKLEQLVLIDTRQQSLLQLHNLAALFAASPPLVPVPQQQQRWIWRLLKLSAGVVTGMTVQMIDHLINHRGRCMALSLVLVGLHMAWALKVENKHGEWFMISGQQEEAWQLFKRLRTLLWRRPVVHLCDLPPNLKLLELSGVGLKHHGSGSSSSCCCKVGSSDSAIDDCQSPLGGGTALSLKPGQQQSCCAASLQAIVLDNHHHQQQQQQSSSDGRRCCLTGSLHSSLGEIVHPHASSLCFFKPGSSMPSSSSSTSNAQWQQQCAAAARRPQLARWKCVGKLAGKVSWQLLKKALLLQNQLHGMRFAGLVAGSLLVQVLLALQSGRICRNSCCWELQVLHKGLSSTSAKAVALAVAVGKTHRK